MVTFYSTSTLRIATTQLCINRPVTRITVSYAYGLVYQGARHRNDRQHRKAGWDSLKGWELYASTTKEIQASGQVLLQFLLDCLFFHRDDVIIHAFNQTLHCQCLAHRLCLHPHSTVKTNSNLKGENRGNGGQDNVVPIKKTTIADYYGPVDIKARKYLPSTQLEGYIGHHSSFQLAKTIRFASIGIKTFKFRFHIATSGHHTRKH